MAGKTAVVFPTVFVIKKIALFLIINGNNKKGNRKEVIFL